MHYCPKCGQACYCHGDIDDCVVETVAYSSLHCVCDCDLEDDSDLHDDPYDDDDYAPGWT